MINNDFKIGDTLIGSTSRHSNVIIKITNLNSTEYIYIWDNSIFRDHKIYINKHFKISLKTKLKKL